MDKSEVEQILSSFDMPRGEFEVVDMETQQGWGTKYLMRLEYKTGKKFIMKGKDPVQVKGLIESSKLTEYFVENGYTVRAPVKTKVGYYSFEKDNTTWNITTYLPGKDSIFEEYSGSTIKSLAEHINDYLNLTIGNISVVESLKLLTYEQDKLFDFLAPLENDTVWATLQRIIPNAATEMQKWVLDSKENIFSIYATEDNKAIIHADLNSKNILTTETSNDVAAIIDWDHCRYDLIYMDLATVTNELTEYINDDKAADLNKTFIKIIKQGPFLEFNQKDFAMISKFQATKNKWESILFYADLLIKYGNTNNEEERFKGTIVSEVGIWRKLVLG